MKTKILSMRTNPALTGLFDSIMRKHPANKTQTVTDAFEYALKNRQNWVAIAKETVPVGDTEGPALIQIKVATDDYLQICNQIKLDMHLTRVQTPFAIKMILTAYLKKLSAAENKAVEEKAEERKQAQQEEIKEKLAYFKKFFPEDQMLLIYEELLNIENEIKELKK